MDRILSIILDKLNLFTGKMKCFEGGKKRLLLPSSFLSIGLAIILSIIWNITGYAQVHSSTIIRMRTLDSEKTGLRIPTGLAFSSKSSQFYIITGSDSEISLTGVTEINKLTPFERRGGTARISGQIWNPINVAFDDKYGRLLFLQDPDNELVEIREGSDGNLELQTLFRNDGKRFGFLYPQGMTVDSEIGILYILDALGPKIIRVEPGSDGSLSRAIISEIKILPGGMGNPRGLAIDPGTGHFYIACPDEQMLFEITQNGRIIRSLDLAPFKLGNIQGMVFAPSGDQTDDPLYSNLYLADSISGEIQEFSLNEPANMSLMPGSFSSSLLRNINLAAISPPSPDPSGLTYLSMSNTLLITDGEVEEKVSGITHFAGANLWEITLNGSPIRTANISPVAPTNVPMTDEPNGITWNPYNGHFYITDDNAYKIFDLNPGIDGLVGNIDDTWTSFDTLALGIGDPEGIAYDSWHNQLFVVDGTNREIYQFTLTGGLIAHFDVAMYGVIDPESVEFNPDTGTLFVLSSTSNPIIIETTTTGTLVQSIDISAINAQAPAGLAYAPASDGSGTKHFYIVDRGIDNNSDPNIIDGKLYEISAPSIGQPTATNTPSMTATGIFTPTATRTFTMTPAPSFTPTSTSAPTKTSTGTFTATSTFTPIVANSPTMTATLTQTSTITPTPTNSPTVIGTPDPAGFPSTGIIDTFNRTDGALGTNWAGDQSSYKITGNQLAVVSNGMIFSTTPLFGADQEAYVTFVNIDPMATNLDLLLKSQTTTKESYLEVWYSPVKKIIKIATYTSTQGYIIYGANIPVTFSNGDQLGVRANADGKVNIYKNGILLGVRDVSAWTNYPSGGYIGILSWGGTPNTRYDNFGGGNIITIPPTTTATSFSSPTLSPTRTNTPSPTVTSTYTPSISKTPTLIGTSTFTPTSLNSPTMTSTVAYTPTMTSTVTQTPTITKVVTFTPTMTPTVTVIPTRTNTATPTSGNTGFLSPAANASQTGGDGNGFEVGAGSTYVNDGLFAVDNNSGTSTSTSCTNAGKDKHRFYNYNISIPVSAIIKGIEIRLDAKADSTSGSPKICVQLSWDGGTSWTSAKSTVGLTTVEASYILGGGVDNWGHVWTAGQLGNTTFRVRVIDVASSTGRDFSLDWVAVQVTYQ
jgi:uncharacterized protein YjiK